MANYAMDSELVDSEAPSSVNEPGEAPIDTLAPVAVESGEAAYQSALQDLRGGRYQEALAALGSFHRTIQTVPIYPMSTIGRVKRITYYVSLIKP